MKALAWRFAAVGFGVWVLGGNLGCAVNCIEDASGTRCTAKSLTRFDGPPPPPRVLDRAPLAPLTIDVQYGNVFVARSASGRVEVEFRPFVYAGHDEDAYARQQLAQNLRLNANAAGAIQVTVGRQGGSNGLGADAIVRIPDGFDGPLNVVNRGDGPINHFDVRIDYVGRASAVSVENRSLLGGCRIQGAPSVRSTNVNCGKSIAVFDVSDAVNITHRDKRHDEGTPAVTLRLAAVPPGSRGGRIATTSGSILATFPRAGGYVVNARSPVRGVVQEGAPPPNCQKQVTSPSQKTVRCGGGPVYELLAGTAPDYIGTPRDSNVSLNY